MRHRAIISGMYVAPEARGKGIGKLLIEALLDDARKREGVEDIVLAVTVGNDSARRLYIQAGFQPYSVDPRFLKIGDQYYDIEWMILSLQE